MTTHSSITFTCDCEVCDRTGRPCLVKETLVVITDYVDGRDLDAPPGWHVVLDTKPSVAEKHICPACSTMSVLARL